MMRVPMKKAASLVAIASLSAGCATGGHTISVHGRHAELTRQVADGRSRLVVKGELIAVDDARVWILGKSGLAEVPRADVARLKVRRHETTGKRGLTWALVGALVTGGAMAIACSSVSEGCGTLFPAMAVPWLAAGAAGKSSLDNSAHLTLPARRLDDARPYARFPQGLPAGFPGPPAPSPKPEPRP
jgi:hypothetical protein